MKKGELSMAMIIGAVIAIVVLIIIIYLVVSGGIDLGNNTKCSSKGGYCTEQYCLNQVTDENGAMVTCPKSGESCCSLT